ncbi:hypothetical protein F4824DRAFT_503759 [Ustulina deusta]|nr:hypothetical protein F4823DRAFT_639007 [Ustulina deusta]KAI3332766.1 hypothetical protein F4824DRAFT_503759 [Ustulina deusta]
MWIPADEALGIAVTGESIHAPESIFVYYYITATDADPPAGAGEHGVNIEPLATSKRPRAMFELGPWLRNSRVLNLGDWLEERYPLMTADYTATQLSDSNFIKQTFAEHVLTFCPFIWLAPELIRTAWEDIRRFAHWKWDELMAIGPDSPIQVSDIQMFRRPSFWLPR